MANDDEGHAHSGAVPVPRAEPSPIEPALQLPFDFYRTPSTRTRPSCHVFPLAIGGDSLDGNGNAATACDARLAAAFGVLLFRYGAQPAVTFNASRVGVGGEPRWREPVTLSTGNDALCRSVLEQAAEFLHRLRGEASARERPERGTESGRAALLFVDGIPGGRVSNRGAPGLREPRRRSAARDLALARKRTSGVPLRLQSVQTRPASNVSRATSRSCWRISPSIRTRRSRNCRCCRRRNGDGSNQCATADRREPPPSSFTARLKGGRPPRPRRRRSDSAINASPTARSTPAPTCSPAI